jgi:hypothetical protein
MYILQGISRASKRRKLGDSKQTDRQTTIMNVVVSFYYVLNGGINE